MPASSTFAASSRRALQTTNRKGSILTLMRKEFVNHAARFLLLVTMGLGMTATAFCDAAEDYYKRGVGKLSQGDTDGAIADFDTAIELNPAFAEAYVTRSRAKLSKRDMEGVLTDATKAIRLGQT